MSYSFTARGADKAEAIANVKIELDRVVKAQPVHAADYDAALAAAKSCVAALSENANGRQVQVSLNGSISTTNEGAQQIVLNLTAQLL